MSNNDYVVEAEYLYNNSGSHDKVYNVALRTNGSQYEVIAEWGARLGVLKQELKYSSPSLLAARLEFNKLVEAKKKPSKGYKSSSSSKSSRSTLTNVPVSSGNSNTIKKLKNPVKEKQPEQFNDSDYIPERRLDPDL
jgi:hypothetical protein